MRNRDVIRWDVPAIFTLGGLLIKPIIRDIGAKRITDWRVGCAQNWVINRGIISRDKIQG